MKNMNYKKYVEYVDKAYESVKFLRDENTQNKYQQRLNNLFKDLDNLINEMVYDLQIDEE